LRPKTTSRPLRSPQDRTRPKFRPTDLNSRLKLWDPISSRRLTRPCSRCPSSWSCNYAPLSNNQFDALPSCSGSPNSPEFSNENSASTTHPGSGLTTFEQAARRQYSRYVTNLQRSQPAVLQTLALSPTTSLFRTDSPTATAPSSASSKRHPAVCFIPDDIRGLFEALCDSDLNVLKFYLRIS